MKLLFKTKEVLPLFKKIKETKEDLLFVKDEGIYLMTKDANPAYAISYSPNVIGLFDRCKAAVGGNDFCDHMPQTVKTIDDILQLGDKINFFAIEFTPETIELNYTY